MDESGRLVPKRGLNFTLSNKTEWKHTSALEFSIKTAPILAPLIEKMPTFFGQFPKDDKWCKKICMCKNRLHIFEKGLKSP